jgi:hypothetical protein
MKDRKYEALAVMTAPLGTDGERILLECVKDMARRIERLEEQIQSGSAKDQRRADTSSMSPIDPQLPMRGTLRAG